jgi:hypothetical protein
MKILLNGDSNMAGEELTDVNQSLGYQFCHMLNGQPINIALTGASNDRIYETTIDYINNNEIDFVLIGWSEMSRLQWFTTAEGYPHFYEINNLGVGRQPLPTEYQARYDHWKRFMADNNEFRRIMSLYWREKIYNLHSLLTYKKIPHLFFHSFNRFHVYDPEYHLDWHNRFIDPYENNLAINTYVQWCMQHDYQQITPGWFHFEPAAQKAWAEFLVDHIRRHDLLVI